MAGGAGYIGSHTCKAFAERGHTPVTLDDLSAGHRWAVKYGPLVEGDFGDTELVARLVAEEGIGAAAIFAGLIDAGESVKNPESYFQTNVTKTRAFVDAAVAAGVRRFVFSSSAAVYGGPARLPVKESAPLRPLNPYGETKKRIEAALAECSGIHNIKYVSLRYFNAAGADSASALGEAHEPETHLIPNALFAAMGLRDALSVYGTDFDTPDGTAIRDYVHVMDLAQAHVSALDYLVSGGQSVALNLGAGAGHSVREVVEAVERVTGLSVPVAETDRRPGDPPLLIADASLASGLIGWNPGRSNLDGMIESAFAFHQRRPPEASRNLAR